MRLNFLMLLLLCQYGAALASVGPSSKGAGDATVLEFNVYLDDKKVGKHSFRVHETGNEKQVRSNARFDYKFLFITAYQYEHSAAEHWVGNCLADIDADTNANGERFTISGTQGSTGFVVQQGKEPVELPRCVMTFAYWNPEILEQHKLLNPQTGEYVDIRVEEVGDEILNVRGKAVMATRFKLVASEVDLTIWYSADNEWLALESMAKGGQIIRYELS
jgi:hypothetical protein